MRWSPAWSRSLFVLVAFLDALMYVAIADVFSSLFTRTTPRLSM